MNQTHERMDTRPKRVRRWTRWAFSVMAALLLSVVFVPNFIRARSTFCQSACINNLRQIDGAQTQWAKEHEKTSGYVLTDQDRQEVATRIKGGLPKCPSGGNYRLLAVGEPPVCDFSKTWNDHRLIPDR